MIKSNLILSAPIVKRFQAKKVQFWANGTAVSEKKGININAQKPPVDGFASNLV